MVIVFISASSIQFAAAQFNIKIPKISKPKVEHPKSSKQTTAPDDPETR